MEMTLGQRLRKAFLKLPCGHGGSQFTSRREGPGLIPPSRVYPPQTGPTDTVAAAPSVPRRRKTPNIHKNRPKSQHVTPPPEQVNGEVRRLSAIAPDYDQYSGPSHGYEHATGPVLVVGNLDRPSPVGPMKQNVDMTADLAVAVEKRTSAQAFRW